MKHIAMFFLGLGTVASVMGIIVGAAWVVHNHSEMLELVVAVGAGVGLCYAVGRLIVEW